MANVPQDCHLIINMHLSWDIGYNTGYVTRKRAIKQAYGVVT